MSRLLDTASFRVSQRNRWQEPSGSTHSVINRFGQRQGRWSQIARLSVSGWARLRGGRCISRGIDLERRPLGQSRTITTLEAQQASDFAGEKLGLLVRYTAASCSSQAAASATRRDGFARVTDRPPSAIATLSCIVPGVRKAMVCHSRPVMIIAQDGERLGSPLDDPDSSSVYVRPAGPASNRPGPRR